MKSTNVVSLLSSMKSTNAAEMAEVRRKLAALRRAKGASPKDEARLVARIARKFSYPSPTWGDHVLSGLQTRVSARPLPSYIRVAPSHPDSLRSI